MAFVTGTFDEFVASVSTLTQQERNRGFVMCCANGLADRAEHLCQNNTIDETHATFGFAYAKINGLVRVMEVIIAAHPHILGSTMTFDEANMYADQFWATFAEPQEAEHY